MLARWILGIDGRAEAQRVYVTAVNDARSGRDTTQHFARTVYEAGYLEKLDSLYSDTSGFLDATATPWHQHLANVTVAELDRFGDGPVAIPSTMNLPLGAGTAGLGGTALAGLAQTATSNEATVSTTTRWMTLGRIWRMIGLRIRWMRLWMTLIRASSIGMRK